MLVERGIQVVNFEVVGDAYAIASNYLRKTGAIPSPEPQVDQSPLATLRRQYTNHLEKERGLAAVTVARDEGERVHRWPRKRVDDE